MFKPSQISISVVRASIDFEGGNAPHEERISTWTAAFYAKAKEINTLHLGVDVHVARGIACHNESHKVTWGRDLLCMASKATCWKWLDVTGTEIFSDFEDEELNAFLDARAAAKALLEACHNAADAAVEALDAEYASK